ncbi:MAG: serine hydrolase domain-containing protein [Spirochaetales bacterium]
MILKRVSLGILLSLLMFSSCGQKVPDIAAPHSVSRPEPIPGSEAGSRYNRDESSIRAFVQLIDTRIEQWMKAYSIPGVAVALIEKGQPVWLSVRGYANKEKKVPLTQFTPCRVESISKSVTAWGVLKLVEEGKISLDTPVQQYLKSIQLPNSGFPLEKITVRHLLSHTAGLFLGTIGVRYAPDGPVPSLREALQKDLVFEREAGTRFSYSNVGFNLLELLIEDITGKKFSQYMQEQVLTPLGMHRASFEWNSQWDPPVPQGYTVSGVSIPPYVYPEKAAGGLFATLEDIARFVSAGSMVSNTDGQMVLKAETKALLYTPVVTIPGLYGLAFPSYGMGHFIEKFADGTVAVSHGGQGSGWMSHFHLVPETGDGIVILTNSQRSWPFFARVLQEWAKWKGYSRPGMSRIIQGENILWVITGGIFLLGGILGFILFRGLLRKERHFHPLTSNSLGVRLGLGSIALTILILLGWAITRDYLFLSSVFPRIVPVLGMGLGLLSIGLLGIVVCPRR